MTNDQLLKATLLIADMERHKASMKKLKMMGETRQIHVRGTDDTWSSLEVDVPDQLRKEIVALLLDYYEQRLTEAKEEFDRL